MEIKNIEIKKPPTGGESGRPECGVGSGTEYTVYSLLEYCIVLLYIYCIDVRATRMWLKKNLINFILKCIEFYILIKSIFKLNFENTYHNRRQYYLVCYRLVLQ